MANDGTITYDYGVIEECVAMMKKKAGEIEQQTSDLENDVKKIMVDWQGSTADSYNQGAAELKNDLEYSKSNLDNLNTALVKAADAMKAQDTHGAKSIH